MPHYLQYKGYSVGECFLPYSWAKDAMARPNMSIILQIGISGAIIARLNGTVYKNISLMKLQVRQGYYKQIDCSQNLKQKQKQPPSINGACNIMVRLKTLLSHRLLELCPTFSSECFLNYNGNLTFSNYLHRMEDPPIPWLIMANVYTLCTHSRKSWLWLTMESYVYSGVDPTVFNGANLQVTLHQIVPLKAKA